MIVIHIMDNLNEAGGVNSFVYDLCEAQIKRGINAVIIAIMGNKETLLDQIEHVERKGIPAYCLCMESKQMALLCGIPKLYKKVKEVAGESTVICNLHLKLAVFMASIAFRKEKHIFLVETYHSQYKNYWLEYNLCKKYISAYIPCSKSAGIEMVNRFHVDYSKLHVIPNGVNQTLIQSHINKEVSCNTYPTLISVGRLTEQKNFQTSAKALSMLKNVDYRYYIIGTGPLRNDIIAASNNDSRIVLQANASRSEVIKKISQADMVIMPSLWEGLSIFLLETITVGCPLVASNIPAMCNVLHEKPLQKDEEWRLCDWGYLVETNNVRAYCDAVKHYLSNLDILKLNMKKRLIEISAEYDIYNTAKKYAEVYTGVLNKK